jgi:hypothetical protein
MFVEHMEPRILLTEIIQFSVTGGGTVTEDPTDGDGNNAAFTIGYTGTLSGNESASVNVSHVLGQTNSSDYTTNVVSAITAAAADTPGVTFSGTTLTFGPAAGTTTTSSKYAGTAVDAPGTGSGTWTNSTAATGSASDYASSTLDSRDYSNELRLTNFGFNIPANATINGVTVTVNTTGSNENMSGPGVKLTKTGTVAAGVAPPSTSNWSSGTVVVGSNAALWGSTWTPAEINSAGFGTILRVRSDDDGYQFRVLSALISVSYTTPSAPAPSSLNFTAQIADDTVSESSEAFLVTLSNAITTSASGAAIVASSASANIIDNDGTSTPVVSIAAVTPTVSESETNSPTYGKLRISRTDSSGSLTVQYAVDGTSTATASTDYTALSGTVTFAAGDVFKDILVVPLDDATSEPAETVKVNLVPASGTEYILSSLSTETTASITITDDDTPPTGTGGGNDPNAGDPIVFSVSGSDTVSEDPQDSDNNQVTYTVGYTGALNAGQTASVNISHSLNQSVASDYTTNVLEAINAAVATTPGVSFNGTTLTFGGTVPTSTSASRFAGTASTASGTGDVAWGSISGAAGSSLSDYAIAQIDNHDVSDQLRLTNYGFNIPSGAVITGITATVSTTGSGTNRGTPGVTLTKNGFSTSGFPPVSSSTWNSGTVTVGGSTSLWGTEWQPADINSGNFGLIIQVESSQTGAEFRVASAEIVVSYTASGGNAASSLTFTVGIADDTEAEAPEPFSIVLSSPTTDHPAGTSLNTASVMTTIVDNDSAASGGTGSGSGTGGETGSGSGNGSGYGTGTDTGTGTGTGTGTETGTETGTGTSTSTTIDTSAADAAFSQSVLGAIETYASGLSSAKAARLAADTQSMNTLVGQIDAAAGTLSIANLASKSTFDEATAAANQAQEAANQADWNQFEYLIGVLEDDWTWNVDDARSVYNAATSAASATRNAADLASYGTFDAALDAADATLAAARGSAGAIRDAAVAAANALYDQTIAAAMAVFDAAVTPYLAAHGYGELGDDGSPSLYATLQTDSQYQSAIAAATAVYDAAVESAEAAFESAWDDAKQIYDDGVLAAATAHATVVATNEATFQAAVAAAVTDYTAAAATHASTADAAIAAAAAIRDAAFAAADDVYDAAVATAASARADAKTAHDSAYDAGEESAWQQLQSALTIHAATHTAAVAAATAAGNTALEAAKIAYDAVANDTASTPSQTNSAFAARLTAVASAIAAYNNSIAAADAAQTNSHADSWSEYDTAVNGLVTVYLNAEATSAAQETYAINAAYVTWANAIASAWKVFNTAETAAEAQQALADAQSANEAWHDINAAKRIWEVADANEDNSYAGVLADLEATFLTTIYPSYVTFADAVADAETSQSIALVGAHAAAVGRWASTITTGSPLPAYMLAREAAVVTKTATTAPAYAAYAHAANAAEAAWVSTTTAVWVAYQDEITDHAATASAAESAQWETFQNAVDDADLEYTNAAVPLWQDLMSGLDENAVTWVNDTVNAAKTYSDSLADHTVAWVEDVTAAEEAWANETVTHLVDYIHTTTALYVAEIGTISTAFNGWAATVAGQISGASGSTTITVGSGVSTGGTAAASQSQANGSGGTSGNGVTWYNPWTWMNPWFNQANLDDAELAEYESMIQEESNILLGHLQPNRCLISYS